ncbi:hypothetical protein [Kocuria carniphila]|uniref:hypothetical protein n=1 Tax=Kocuria carniphila TaxID=262208 RepID=UPI0034CE2655
MNTHCGRAHRPLPAHAQNALRHGHAVMFQTDDEHILVPAHAIEATWNSISALDPTAHVGATAPLDTWKTRTDSGEPVPAAALEAIREEQAMIVDTDDARILLRPHEVETFWTEHAPHLHTAAVVRVGPLEQLHGDTTTS